jgi:sugar/nucleoside kinase (ribokinase family)
MTVVSTSSNGIGNASGYEPALGRYAAMLIRDSRIVPKSTRPACPKTKLYSKVEAPTIDVVDTIGAGDSFQAALLFALRAVGWIERGALMQMNAGELHLALSFAAASR